MNASVEAQFIQRLSPSRSTPRSRSWPPLSVVPQLPSASSIGIVLHDFSLGGTERIAIRLANEWVEQGRSVTILCGTEDGPLRSLLSPDVILMPLHPVLPRGFGSRRKLGKAAAAIFANSPVDLVFIPGNFHWQVVPALARLPVAVRPRIAAQLSTPLIRYDRGTVHQHIYNRWTRWLLRGADAAISLDDTMTGHADSILRNRITQRIRLPALQHAPVAPLPLDPANRTIVAAGRLVGVKGFDIAIAAFALLDDLAARLVILGDGPLKQELQDQAERLGVADRVAFPGYVECIRPWLDKAGLFLLSSRYEGYPAVLIEALAAGRPVVATRCTPAIGELVDGTGFGASAPINDPVALAAAIAGVFAAVPPDPAKMEAAVVPFGIENCARDYLGMFDTLCAS
ncbi:MAG: glycosyltransferase [Sphingomonadales bacterium]|nr:glycosyltransferase [Sphingomonadales bacterium]